MKIKLKKFAPAIAVVLLGAILLLLFLYGRQRLFTRTEPIILAA